MTIQIGERIPEVPLQRIREGVETVDTNALFDSRNIVLFAVCYSLLKSGWKIKN